MNEVTGQVLLATAMRNLIAVIRETRARVLLTESTPDEEAVHDFRVALRRCRTMLRVARNIWSTKRILRIDHELRYYARTTGKLRDDEVLRSTLASLPSTEASADEVKVWLDKRAATERWGHRAVLRIVREGPTGKDARTEKGKRIRPLDDVVNKLEVVLDKPGNICSAHELARVSVETALESVRRAAQSDVHDGAAMHALRIREKRLRYTIELFSNELGDEGERLLTHATRMQRRLGDMHDVDEAIATIRRARSLGAVTRLAILEALHIARGVCTAKVEAHLSEARALELPLALSCNESSPSATT